MLLAGAIAVMLVGVLGTLLPLLPGVPLVWVVAALYGWYGGFAVITPGYLALTAGLVVLAAVGDHYARAWGARRFGAGRAGAWGAVIGSLVGLFFMPIGLLAGPFIGAVAAEMMAGRRGSEAMRAGLGSLIGVVAGTGLNFAVALAIFLTFLYRVLGGA